MIYDFFEKLKEIIIEFMKKCIGILKYLSVFITFIIWIVIFLKFKSCNSF